MQGSWPQEACCAVGAPRAAWRGRSITSSPWGASTAMSKGSTASLYGSFLHNGRLECRFLGPPRLPSEFKNPPICNYGGSLSELSSAAATLEWEPALDNLLLVVSIALAYIAGIVTPSSPPPQALTEKASSASLEMSQELEAVQELANEASFLEKEDLWNLARFKLSNSVDLGDDMADDTQALNPGQGLQLSLQALARGPRLRLLLVTLEQLNKEVGNWQQNESFLHPDWSAFSTQRLCEVVIAICRLWMCGEHMRNLKDQHLMKGGCVPLELIDTNYLSEWNSRFDSYSQNYGGRKSMKSTLLATGKAEFYADFLYFMCAGHARQNGYGGAETSRSDRNLVLEDLIIFVADKASALYLDLISTGSTVCDSQWFNIMAQSIPSTRSLEKFRNEVALNGWLNDNFQSVTAMFEDRYDLWILCSSCKNLEKQSQSKVQFNNRRQKPEKAGEQSTLVIQQYKLFCRRARELRALTGWRYYFSLYLEFSDVCGPLLRTIVTKLGEGIAFLLVTLIGRSLGLIYRGICQSVQWNSS